jgi:hypothetical protein
VRKGLECSLDGAERGVTGQRKTPDYALLHPSYEGETCISLFVGERKIMNHFLVKTLGLAVRAKVDKSTPGDRQSRDFRDHPSEPSCNILRAVTDVRLASIDQVNEITNNRQASEAV